MYKFNEIVEKIFKIAPEQIQDNLTQNDIPEWDSMNYLLFISELEKTFELSFTMDEVINTKYLGDLKKIIEERGTK